MTNVRFELQINDRAGLNKGLIRIPFKSYQNIKIKKTLLKNRGGKVVKKIKPKEYYEVSQFDENTFFSDAMLKCVDVLNNSYPFTIELEYEISTSEYMYLAHWTPSFDYQINCRSSSLLIKSKDERIHFFKNGNFKVNSSQIDDYHTLSCEFENYEYLENQPYPYLIAYTEEFNYGVKGSFLNWVTFGNWIFELNKGLENLSDNEKFKVQQLVGGVTDKREMVKILYEYLQDRTTYFNISLDVGGFKPLPASYVGKNKYGDCKALTIYMKALLNEVNIPSIYTLVNAGFDKVKINDTLTINQFNHVILAVPIDRDTIWLENTSKTSPFGYVGSFIQNRKALLIEKDKSKLTEIPKLRPKDVIERFDFKISLNEKESLDKITFHGNFSGPKAEHIRYLQAQNDDKSILAYLLSELNISKFTLDQIENISIEKDSFSSTVNSTFYTTSLAKKYGNRYIIEPFLTINPNSHISNNHDHHLLTNFPINKVITLELKHNNQNLNPNIPSGKEFKTLVGEYSSSFKKNEKNVIVKYHLKINNDIPVKDEILLTNFNNEIIKNEESYIIQWKQ